MRCPCTCKPPFYRMVIKITSDTFAAKFKTYLNNGEKEYFEKAMQENRKGRNLLKSSRQ